VIETSSPALRQNARIPRGQGYETGAADEFTTTQAYPRTGSGFTADKNGKLIPEWSTLPTQMDGGVDALGTPVTTMKFRHADGTTPYPHTRTVNGQSVTASDWKLTEPQPGAFVWEPL